METNPIRVCELLVGLPDVTVLGVVDDGGVRPPCRECRVLWRKDSDEVELVDLPVFGGPARLVWRKRRWECPDGLLGEIFGKLTPTATTLEEISVYDGQRPVVERGERRIIQWENAPIRDFGASAGVIPVHVQY